MSGSRQQGYAYRALLLVALTVLLHALLTPGPAHLAVAGPQGPALGARAVAADLAGTAAEGDGPGVGPSASPLHAHREPGSAPLACEAPGGRTAAAAALWGAIAGEAVPAVLVGAAPAVMGSARHPAAEVSGTRAPVLRC